MSFHLFQESCQQVGKRDWPFFAALNVNAELSSICKSKWVAVRVSDLRHGIVGWFHVAVFQRATGKCKEFQNARAERFLFLLSKTFFHDTLVSLAVEVFLNSAQQHTLEKTVTLTSLSLHPAVIYSVQSRHVRSVCFSSLGLIRDTCTEKGKTFCHVTSQDKENILEYYS